MKIEDIDREFRELAKSLKEAETAFKMGQFTKAEPLYKRALELVEKSYGEEHEDTVTCLQNLGDTYYALKRYQESIPLLRRLLLVRERQLGPAHGDVATVLFKLAKSYEKLGKVGEAESFYRRALRVGEQAYGQSNTFVATILESFAAMLRRAQIRLPEVEAMEERLRDMREHSSNVKASKAILLDNLSLSIPPGSDQGAEIARAAERADTGRLRSLKSRGDRLGIPERAPEALSPHSIMVSIVTLVVVLGAGTGVFLYMHTNESGSQANTNPLQAAISQLFGRSPGAATPSGNQANQQPNITYFAPDGIKQIFLENTEHTATVTTRSSHYTGKFTIDGDDIKITPNNQSSTISFKQAVNAVVDQEGTILYQKRAPEGRIIDKMHTLAFMANKYYRSQGHYPRDMNAMAPVMQSIGYVNPFNGRSAFPVKKFIQGADKDATDIDLNDYSALEAAMKEFVTYNPGATQEPGVVEFFSTPNAPEGESMYIRGTDRNGKFLRASNASQNFVIMLVQGQRRTTY